MRVKCWRWGGGWGWCKGMKESTWGNPATREGKQREPPVRGVALTSTGISPAQRSNCIWSRPSKCFWMNVSIGPSGEGRLPQKSDPLPDNMNRMTVCVCWGARGGGHAEMKISVLIWMWTLGGKISRWYDNVENYICGQEDQVEDIPKFKTKTYQNSKQRDKEMEIMREQMRGLENRFMNIKRKRQWKDKIIIDILEEIFHSYKKYLCLQKQRAH